MTRTIDGKGSRVETLPGGEAIEWDTTYVVYHKGCIPVPAPIFPIILKAGKGTYEIRETNAIENGIRTMMKYFNLNQIALHDTYKCSKHISVNKMRRECVDK